MSVGRGAGGGLTGCLADTLAALCRLVVRGLALAWLAIMPGQAAAAQAVVVLSDDSAPYQEVYQVIRAYLDDSGHTLTRLYVSGLKSASLNDARLVIPVGVRASEALAEQSFRQPVLAVLVPRAWYAGNGHAQLTDGGRRSASAIYIDQPFDRQARLIRQAFPELRRVGVLLSEGQGELLTEIEDALRAQRLALVSRTLVKEERLIKPLEKLLSESELLLAVPDSQVFNRNTAQSLFLTSYRYRDPVLGYSDSLTRAGALLSLYSSPAQIARQAAEWARVALDAPSVRLPAPSHPVYFSVSVNDQVARSLGFTLPAEAKLEKALGR
ncbi:MAG: hypothetical protein R6W97_07230 [Thiobacillus sp.]